MRYEKSAMIEWIKKKKIIIYGVGKIQQDFQYIFDWIVSEYYVDSNKMILDKPNIYPINKILEEKLDDILVIVCIHDKKEAEQNLVELGLSYKKNFLWVDDLFYLLDDVDEEYVLGKNVYIWGCGKTQKNLERGLKENGYNFSICGYIDNNSEVWGGKIISPEKLPELKDVYIIVASVYYASIKGQLEKMGLKEDRDFVCFSKFMVRPSQMMKKTIYDKPLKLGRCLMMERMTYTHSGIYPCCVMWVDYPIGNPVVDSCVDSWKSIVMKLYRLSVENRTYSFCKKGICKFLPKYPETDEKERDFYLKEFSTYPHTLALGLDDSCNLRCESCRNELRFTKEELLKERKRYAQDLLDSGWLEKVDEVFTSIEGEVFANEVDRMVLFGGQVMRDNIHILTNGNLLDEKNWNCLENSYKKIQVSISIDAATAETYNILRRGGNWQRLQKNLAMLSDKRKGGILERVEIKMVVQRKNYKEMVDFVKMAKKYQFDQVTFTRINNYGIYTDEEYADISMIGQDGHVSDELEKVLRDSIFEDKIVNIAEFSSCR